MSTAPQSALFSLVLLFHQFPFSPAAQVRAVWELLFRGETLRRLADAAPIDSGDGHDSAGVMSHFSPLGPTSQSATSSMRSTRRSGAGSFSVSGWKPYVTPQDAMPALRAVCMSTLLSPIMSVRSAGMPVSRSSAATPMGSGFFKSKLLPP